ncbi:hypothetical protein KR767_05715 [Luteibacter anthropi]|uniref:Secreted protein n=2 Tax=Luteibacter anthropi TaxID=564369 RepID=A0A7X5UCN2_9GAMM|nr:hypothetical protein [Luteibacter anthropi]NII08026.1 hypothetical protein [Luteibacter anthropi]URX63558.1 hypothetical protein KR767_05715 [Luteibacter anthropi]
MRKLSAGLAGIFVTGMLMAGSAQALPKFVTTYVFYSGTQAIGQSILYCNGVRQHWGEAVSTNLDNAVSVTYSCVTGDAMRVGYPTGIDPWVKQNFCSTSAACEVGPWPIPGAGTLLNGSYSDIP